MEDRIKELEFIVHYLIKNNPEIQTPPSESSKAIIQEVMLKDYWNDGEDPAW